MSLDKPVGERESPDRREVGRCGPDQLEAVGLVFRNRLLVREDARHRAVRCRVLRSRRSSGRSAGRGHPVRVERGLGVLLAPIPPTASRRAAARRSRNGSRPCWRSSSGSSTWIALPRWRRSELGPLVGADDVVQGRDEAVQIQARVVAQPCERLESGISPCVSRREGSVLFTLTLT